MRRESHNIFLLAKHYFLYRQLEFQQNFENFNFLISILERLSSSEVSRGPSKIVTMGFLRYFFFWLLHRSNAQKITIFGIPVRNKIEKTKVRGKLQFLAMFFL